MMIPLGYQVRELRLDDYENDYLETLKELTTVGMVSYENFAQVFKQWQALPDIYHARVIVNEHGKVVASGMLLIEQKAIHNCGKVGHIEDIAVAGNERGKKLGYLMIEHLTEIARQKGCYKVILDCSTHNETFYKKCGYHNAGIEMVKRFP